MDYGTVSNQTLVMLGIGAVIFLVVPIIISIIWKNGNPHWCMAYKGKVIEASYGDFYPKMTNTLKSRLSKSGKQSVAVYRAK